MSSNQRPEVVALAANRHKQQPQPGCSCPPWRYSPAHPRPTNPQCPRHGTRGARNP